MITTGSTAGGWHVRTWKTRGRRWAQTSLGRWALACACAISTGCAVGNTHDFRHVPHPIESVGGERIVLLFDVKESRRPIVDEGEPPSWVGEQRSGFGIPYNVLTRTRRPFAEIVRKLIEEDLAAAGFSVEVGNEAADGRDAIARQISEVMAERGLTVELRRFNSNTYTNIDVEWDLLAEVYDATGRRLAENHLEGRETLPGSFMNPPAAAKKKVPPFFSDLLRELIVDDDEVMAALAGETPPDEAREGCSVEQILTMKDSGLSQGQIEAACGSRANDEGN